MAKAGAAMSLADEVLGRHVGHRDAEEVCRLCDCQLPCESVRLALSLQAAGQVVEAARDWHLRAYVEGWCDCGEGLCEMAQALAEYDKGGQG